MDDFYYSSYGPFIVTLAVFCGLAFCFGGLVGYLVCKFFG